MQHIIKIKSIKHLTHDVLKIVTEKPKEFDFTPGQAAEISIDKKNWLNETRPFTFTNLPHQNYLEFVIKTYPSHKGVTNELLQLKKNDKLILHNVFGAIKYYNEGLFIAGGAGITPFISIFNYLHSKKAIGNNKLIFANKTKDDIILETDFRNLLRYNFINILSEEKVDNYEYGFINEDLLKKHINRVTKNIYICGPEPMIALVEKQLTNLNVNKKLIIKEAL